MAQLSAMAVSTQQQELGTAARQKALVWPVEKYARFVAGTQTSAASSAAKKSDGIWQHYSSKEGGIHLALVESNHLMVSSGTMIFESFSLWEAQKWLKIVTRGDSAMFIYRVKDDNRRFRVKFSPLSPLTTALDTCKQFVMVMAPLVPLKEMEGTRDKDPSTRDSSAGSTQALDRDSQLIGYGEESQMLEYSQMVPASQLTQSVESTQSHTNAPGSVTVMEPDESSLIPVPDLGKLLQTQGKSLGRAYADTNFPTEQLGQFIRLCLTDANFPGFVESVERELNRI